MENKENENFINRFLDSLKKGKYSKYLTWVLIGILVLVAIIPVKKNSSRISKTTEAKNIENANDSYEEYYEKRLKQTLESVYGPGTMEVMIHISVESKQAWYGDSSDQKTIEGVLVVAHVNDSNAAGDISYAVCSLFDLPAHKVAVMVKPN